MLVLQSSCKQLQVHDRRDPEPVVEGSVKDPTLTQVIDPALRIHEQIIAHLTRTLKGHVSHKV
jgi:hypothetical protein